MKDKIVIDIETSNTFADVGRNNFNELNVSVVVIYSYNEDRYISYNEDEIDKLGDKLKETDLIIGFAINRFDLPVLSKHYDFNLFDIPSIDILDDIEIASGKRVSLDILARENLGEGKTGKGADAPKLYEEGRLEELRKYCENDVKITKKVYELAKNQGHLMIPKRFSDSPIKVQLDWSKKLAYQRLF